MVLILNKEHVLDKKCILSFRLIFGIGNYYIKYLLSRVGASEKIIVQQLNREHIRMLSRLVIKESFFDVELLREIREDIKKKIDINSYQGLRHLMCLPVHGQRTKTNRKTAKRLLSNINNGK